jgi:hypothetical protein
MGGPGGHMGGHMGGPPRGEWVGIESLRAGGPGGGGSGSMHSELVQVCCATCEYISIVGVHEPPFG